MRRMPSRHPTVVGPTSSCIRVRSICTLSIVSVVGAKPGVRPVSSPRYPHHSSMLAAWLPPQLTTVAGVPADAQQSGDHGQDVVLVDRVVDARGVDVDGDVAAVDHHLEVDRRPAAPVAVGHGQPGDGGRQPEPVGAPQRRGLGGDLGDAVGAQERPHAVVVAERIALGEDVMAHRLVDAGGGAVQECLAAWWCSIR